MEYAKCWIFPDPVTFMADEMDGPVIHSTVCEE